MFFANLGHKSANLGHWSTGEKKYAIVVKSNIEMKG